MLFPVFFFCLKCISILMGTLFVKRCRGVLNLVLGLVLNLVVCSAVYADYAAVCPSGYSWNGSTCVKTYVAACPDGYTLIGGSCVKVFASTVSNLTCTAFLPGATTSIGYGSACSTQGPSFTPIYTQNIKYNLPVELYGFNKSYTTRCVHGSSSF